MKQTFNSILVLVLFVCSSVKAEEGPQFQGPQKEHEWLQQIVGEWDVESECSMMPGEPAMKWPGTETIRSIGGLWTITESNSKVMDTVAIGVMTLGYDPERKKYVGTWIDSVNNYMWRYEGTLDESGKKLTLDTEGPSMTEPGKKKMYKESIEIKDKDHKVFTSSIEVKDGEWYTFMTSKATRKK